MDGNIPTARRGPLVHKTLRSRALQLKLGHRLFYCIQGMGVLAEPIGVLRFKRANNAPSAPVDERKWRIPTFRRRLQRRWQVAPRGVAAQYVVP